jgi:hypothetical protein
MKHIEKTTNSVVTNVPDLVKHMEKTMNVVVIHGERLQ